jgi:acetylornithine deacetylase
MLGFTLNAFGKAAHSGYPWLGRSANEVLVQALSALMQLSLELPKSDKYGSTTINIGKIEGGVAGNVVAQNASAQIAIRIAAGTPDDIGKRVHKAIKSATDEFKAPGHEDEDMFEIVFAGKGYAPVDIDHDVEGFGTITVNYGTDIPNLDKLDGQKRYLYGPGSILVAHSDHEAITLSDLETAVQDYEKLILHSLS